MNMEDIILVVKGALSKEQCQSLIQEYDARSTEAALESCYHAITNKMTTSTYKRVELIPATDTFNLVHDVTNDMIIKWIDHLDKMGSFHVSGLKKSLRYSHLHRLMKYEEGEWIHPHVDWEEMIHASCTIALNDGYEGGDFSFWNGKHTVKLEQGDAMIWPADPFWVHEVTTITKGCRYATNTFIQSLPQYERAQMGDMIWAMGKAENVKNAYWYSQCEEESK